MTSLDSLKKDVFFRAMGGVVQQVLSMRARRSTDVPPMHETTIMEVCHRYLDSCVGAEEALLAAFHELMFFVKESMASRSPSAFLLLIR